MKRQMIVLLACLLTVVGFLPMVQGVILNPGYVEGDIAVGSESLVRAQVWAQVSFGPQGYTDTWTDRYDLVVEGDYEYRFFANMFLRDGYTTMLSPVQHHFVGVGDTVQCDFVFPDPGYIRWSVSTSAGQIDSVRVYADHVPKLTPYTNAYDATQYKRGPFSYHQSDFPIYPGDTIEVKAYVTYMGLSFWVGPETISVDHGETVDVNFNIDELPLATVDGHINVVGEQFEIAQIHNRHVDGPYSRILWTDEDFEMAVMEGDNTIYPHIYLNDNNDQMFLYKNYNIQEGEEKVIDFDFTPGHVEGDIIITGANTDLKEAYIHANTDESPLYIPGLASQIRARSWTHTDTTDYRLILAPDYEWELAGRYPNQYYFNYPDPADAGLESYLSTPYSEPDRVTVDSGNVLNKDFGFCTATLTTYFEIEGGGTLSLPNVNGYTFSEPYRQAWVGSEGSDEETELGKVVLTMVPGNYWLRTQAKVGNSVTSFGNFGITVGCGDEIYQTINAPLITIESPEGGAEFTSGTTQAITGLVTDPDTWDEIVEVRIDGEPVSFQTTNNSQDLVEVAFESEIFIQPGANTFTVWAMDTTGKTAEVSRTVYGTFGNPPAADVGGPYAANEGNTIFFDASDSIDPDGDTLRYRWDFDNDGVWDTDWDDSPYAEYTWGDDYVGEVAVEVSDGELTDAATADVSVYNIVPAASIESAYMDLEIGLRMAGRKLNNVALTLYEGENAIGVLEIERVPGDPDENPVVTNTLPATLDISKAYTAVITYIPEDLGDGKKIGGNPVWLMIDGEQVVQHIFNTPYGHLRGDDNWGHADPLVVEINPLLVGKDFTVSTHVEDPGSDDIYLDYTYGTQTASAVYYNDGTGPDPYPSPDVNSVDIVDAKTFVYEGEGTISGTVTDDDGGITSFDVDSAWETC